MENKKKVSISQSTAEGSERERERQEVSKAMRDRIHTNKREESGYNKNYTKSLYLKTTTNKQYQKILVRFVAGNRY